MKTATVADLRNHFSHLGKWIRDGESVEITMHGEPFATLVPKKKKNSPKPWPDLQARLKKIYPNGPVKGATTDEILDYMREDH